jgi:hypothetical protein
MCEESVCHKSKRYHILGHVSTNLLKYAHEVSGLAIQLTDQDGARDLGSSPGERQSE